MLFSRIAARPSRVALAHYRDSLLAFAHRNPSDAPVLFNLYHSLVDSSNKVIASHESQLHHMNLNRYAFQHCNMSSSASPQPNEKDTGQSGNEAGKESESSAADTKAEATEQHDASEEAKVSDEKDRTGSSTEPKSSGSDRRKRRSTKWFKFSDSDSDSDSRSELSKDDLVKLVKKQEDELKNKHEELQKMQDKALRTYAEMQNSMDRTKREAENLKKFAIQDFTKSLLDVADNLGRASSVVKKDLLKLDDSKEDAALQLLKSLIQGVEMTEKQLAEVFKKYGVEKDDPLNEEFDPHRHNAVFQVPDASKPPGTIAHVLKSGYILHGRVIRPAEVGVTQAVEEKDAEHSSAE